MNKFNEKRESFQMPIIPNIAAYHCNDQDRCSKFVSKGDLIWCEEDGIWLGSGMYFWDNLYNAACYWKHQKEYKSNSQKYVVVQAGVMLDHMLDLTDSDIVNGVAKVWKSYCDILHYSYNELLGKKLNFLFEHNKKFASKYFIIKIYGKYNGTISNELFEYSVHSRNNEPTLSIKCIYSVRDSRCIISKSVYNEEENNDE